MLCKKKINKNICSKKVKISNRNCLIQYWMPVRLRSRPPLATDTKNELTHRDNVAHMEHAQQVQCLRESVDAHPDSLVNFVI